VTAKKLRHSHDGHAERGFAMINDMASLKQAMEQMDADDVVVAQAAKDRAAHILSDARLNFAKLAELIEQRRLLLRPKILASIKRMDQPASLGDAAFRDTGASLRKEGQSFRQIADALELTGATAADFEEPSHRGELLHQVEFHGERDDPASSSAPPLMTHAALYPLRHPIRFLVIAVLSVMLFNALRDLATSGRQIPGYRASIAARQHVDAAMSSVKRVMRSPEEAGTPPAPPAPIPSASPAEQPLTTPPAGPANSSAPATAAPSTNESPAPTAKAAPSAPAPSTSTPPHIEAKSASPSAPTANDTPRTARSRIFDDLMPDRLRRNSRLSGPCTGGAGGCYWGGGQY
jgi:hypothetical protein